MSRRRTFGTIRKLPSGRYQARYSSPDGVRHRASRSFATKAEASRWLASSENDLARGTWTDPDAARVSLDVYARGWLRARPNLRPRTIDLYESLLERHIILVLGHHSLGKLTPATVRRWNADLVRRSGSGSLTPAKCYRLLRTILNTALADGLIAESVRHCRCRNRAQRRAPRRDPRSGRGPRRCCRFPISCTRAHCRVRRPTVRWSSRH